ncbi:lysophospholipid acyltransferase family protein [Mangrovihabitans endophyticus]|uniref:1-acyl-sn-glycerol-3-phosphate acyltransferase n=1 Tax=Mangrovihabitans endophyticus TaxID=1751298 RepID=A0A8J3C348_9ACTN|nr:lysophospholipid acyltransferase family protein [Mangrovihabitans endophyticus]GGL01349.1 1-acyl-sn-glycerol-3-phosphate acyltransferase [Mangrovihabitans endophyticus]
MIWQPTSGCGPHCYAEDGPRVRYALWRLPLLIGVLAVAALTVPVLRGAAVRLAARGVLASLGVRLQVRGPAPRAGSLLVANHVSWLDVVALLAIGRMRLVAKHDVRGWPVIGAMAAGAGAIFLDRSRPKTLPTTVAEVSAALRDGRSVAVFPEGTTFCGADRGRFRPAVFQAAVDARAPVVPVAIRYDSTAVAFVGAETLWSSVLRVARTRSLAMTVITAPALHPADGAVRGALARAAQSSVGLRSAPGRVADLGLAA